MQASAELGAAWNTLLDLGRKVTHQLNRNTRSGSRRNIAAHYDLSNEFYSQFLDETMTYSSGVFPMTGSSMKEASIEKYDRICRKLRLVPKIMCWRSAPAGEVLPSTRRPSMAVASRRRPSRDNNMITPRSDSHDQWYGDRVNLLCSDYRDLTVNYDKLVSIEMIEAVGHEYFDTFFQKCSSLLKPDGLLALQAITIPDQRYEAYRKSVDFIQKYIFPGGCLPSLGAMTKSVGTNGSAVHPRRGLCRALRANAALLA